MDQKEKKGINGLKLISELNTSYGQDIESIWFGNSMYFGIYKYSGLRAITGRLAQECLTLYKK